MGYGPTNLHVAGLPPRLPNSRHLWVLSPEGLDPEVAEGCW